MDIQFNKKLFLIFLFLLVFTVFQVDAVNPKLILSNQTVLDSSETAYIFNDYSNVAVNNKVKLKDHQYLDDKEKNKQYQLSYKVPKNSRALKVDKIVSRIDNRYDFKVSSIDGSSIDFHLADFNSTNNISIVRYDGLPTEVVRVDNVSVEYAEIVIVKTYETYISDVLHSEDGINFVKSGLEFSQNKTHIWFNTTHFSSFTGSIPNFDLIIGGSSELFDVDDYATIDSGHYIKMFYPNSGSSSTLDNKGFTGSDFTCEIATNDLGNDAFQICLNADNEVILDALSGYDPIDDSVTACIYTGGDSLEDCDSFNVAVSEFQLPYCTSAVSETDITKTSATLRGRVYFGDFTGTVEGSNGYRDFSLGGAYDYDVYSVISDGSIFTRGITGLTPDTTYQSLVRYKYTYESVTYFETCDVSGLFTTLADVSPTITTLSVTDLTGTTATLRGLPDKGDFTGTVTGHFWYKKVSDPTWIEVEKGSITDDTIFSHALTSLDAGVEYQYFASIEWNDGGLNVVDGDIIFFTPQNPVAGFDNVFLYWTNDDADIISTDDISDISGNNRNGISFGSVNTGAVGKINEAFDFDSVTTDYTRYDNADVSFSDNGGCMALWVKQDSYSDGAIFFSLGDSANTDEKAIILDTFSNFFRARIYQRIPGSIANTVSDTTDISSDTTNYYHIALSWDSDGDINHFWVDAVDKGSDSTENIDLSSADYIQENGFTFGNDDTLNVGNFDIDEVYVKDLECDQQDIDYLYNNGDGARPGEGSSPIVTTISPININQSGVTLRGIADFGSFTGDVYGTFQYKLNSSSTWINIGDVVTPISNDTIFSYILENLTSNIQYDYRAVLTWFDSQSLNAFGSLISFNTLKTSSFIQNVSVTDIKDDNVNLSFEYVFNDMIWVNYIISYDEWTAIESGSPVWNDIGPTNTTVEGFQYYHLQNLSTGVKYGYYVSSLDENSIYYTDIIPFIPGEGSIPLVENVYFDRILRNSSYINFNVSSMGNYSQFLAKVYVAENGNAIYNLNNSIVINNTGDYDLILDNLKINQSYDVFIEVDYIVDFYKVFTDGFKTKSLDDFIAPFVKTVDPYVDGRDFNVSIDISLNDATSLMYKYIFSGAFEFETIWFEANASVVYTDNFTASNNRGNVSVSTFYSYYNTTEIVVDSLDDYSFELAEAPIIPREVCIVADVCIFVRDPALFGLLLITFIPFLLFSFTLFGDKKSNSIANKIIFPLMFVLVFFGMVWLYFVQLILFWLFTTGIVGEMLIGYLVLRSVD